jgi:hypothetical protein
MVTYCTSMRDWLEASTMVLLLGVCGPESVPITSSGDPMEDVDLEDDGTFGGEAGSGEGGANPGDGNPTGGIKFDVLPEFDFSPVDSCKVDDDGDAVGECKQESPQQLHVLRYRASEDCEGYIYELVTASPQLDATDILERVVKAVVGRI